MSVSQKTPDDVTDPGLDALFEAISSARKTGGCLNALILAAGFVGGKVSDPAEVLGISPEALGALLNGADANGLPSVLAELREALSGRSIMLWHLLSSAGYMRPDPPSEFLLKSIPEVARYFRVSERQAYRWNQEGMPVFWKGNKCLYDIRRIKAWLQGGKGRTMRRLKEQEELDALEGEPAEDEPDELEEGD